MSKSWLVALKEWNSTNGGSWCIPKAGSKGHDEVKAIMRGESPAGKKAQRQKREAVDVANIVAGKRERKKKQLE
jgi:hypothetical protein